MSPFLPGTGEHEWTNGDQGFDVEDDVADTLQARRWGRRCKTRTQNAHRRTRRGKAACIMLLLTAHLTTARTDCAVCYLTYCRLCYEYMSTPTPRHISHASTTAHSATAAIRNHVYDISGSQLLLELDPAVLAVSSGTPVFSIMRNQLLIYLFHYTLNFVHNFRVQFFLHVDIVDVQTIFHEKYTIIFYIIPLQIYMLRSSGTWVTYIELILKNVPSVAILVLYIFCNFTPIRPAYEYFRGQLQYHTSLQNPKVSDFNGAPKFLLSRHYYRLQGIKYDDLVSFSGT